MSVPRACLAVALGLTAFAPTLSARPLQAPATPLAEHEEVYLEVHLADAADLDALGQRVDIDRADPAPGGGVDVRAYAIAGRLAALSAFTADWRILPHPGDAPGVRMARDVASLKASWDSYPTYDQYVSLMEGWARDYPSLARLEVIGASQEGHELLALRLGDRPGQEEDEPEVFLTSTMHGDETTGYVLMLRLIDTLLSGYGRDEDLTRLMDGVDLMINPLANPDGAYRRTDRSVWGSRRYLADGVDANRNFPDPQDGQHPDGRAWSEETVAMMALAEEHSFILSANFHGGAELVNYPWDTWPRMHPDLGWFVDLSRAWADQAHADGPAGYMTDRDDGITNGYAWYEVNGGRQDYMAWFHGGREVTVELSTVKTARGGALPDYWDANRQAFLDYISLSLKGIRGTVRDAAGAPVAATVTVVGHDEDHSEVFTDPDVGDFHRLIAPGTWDLRITADGFRPAAVTGVVVGDGDAARVDVVLTRQ